MKKLLFIFYVVFFSVSVRPADKIKVVATLSTYSEIAQIIGGDRVEASYIVAGNQDAHFVRPKPSYATLLKSADLFISTGLDLELWVPRLVDMSKNPNIRSGQPGFVSAGDGVALLDKPEVLSRSEGGLHIYGNPHFTTNPLNLKKVAENILIGLKKIDPASTDKFQKNFDAFVSELDKRMFGEKLVKLMGSKILTKLANSGKLISFLKSKSYKGTPMIDRLGGWLKKAMPFRGKKIIAYHKNWVYFERLFGAQVLDYVEPKPGIPPSPRHVDDLLTVMKENKIDLILAANYFDTEKVNSIAERVGAKAVIVPMYVHGAEGTDSIFDLVDFWIDKMNIAVSN